LVQLNHEPPDTLLVSDFNVVLELKDIALIFENRTIFMLNNETTVAPTSQAQLSTLVYDATWAFHCKRERWKDTAQRNDGTRWIKHHGNDWFLDLGERTIMLQYLISALLLTSEGAWLLYHNTLWHMSDPYPQFISQQNTTLFKAGDTWNFMDDSSSLHGSVCIDDLPDHSYFRSRKIRAYYVSFITLVLICLAIMAYFISR